MNKKDFLLQQLSQRILFLDGATGTMIQSYHLEEQDYRGERFKNWESDLKGNNDLLSLTQPDIIKAIHTAYLDAGADIIETNTFNATTIAMADYNMESLAYEINVEAAKIAKQAGANELLREKVLKANTSIEALKLCQQEDVDIASVICREALKQARRIVPKRVALDLWVVNRQGELVGCAYDL